MTHNNTFVSRRDRRARQNTSSKTAGRTAAAVIASAGLVIGTGVAASADASATEGRALTTVDVDASTLSVERASVQAASTVSTPAEINAELSFDRPAVSSESTPEPEPEPEPEPQAAAPEPAAEAPAPAPEPAPEQPAQEAPQPQQSSQPAQSSNGGGSSSGSGQSGSSSQSSSSGQSGSSSQSGSSGQSSSSSQSAPSSSSGGRGGVVSAAYSTLGTPHVMGGTTPGSGIDCSGMIQYAYAQAGISVPRTTHGMAGLPQVSSPVPGDIVLANGNSHGGIYVGNGQVISTTSSAGVRVHGINDGWHNVTTIHRPG